MLIIASSNFVETKSAVIEFTTVAKATANVVCFIYLSIFMLVSFVYHVLLKVIVFTEFLTLLAAFLVIGLLAHHAFVALKQRNRFWGFVVTHRKKLHYSVPLRLALSTH